MQFKSTNEVWLITRCIGPCVKSDTSDSNAPAFKISFKRITKVPDEVDPIEWSLYITICFGFSLMLIAFLYFEWRTLFKCIQRCQEKGCGKSQARQIGFVDDRSDGAVRQNSEENQNESQQDVLDEQINYNLDRLTQKNKKNDDYGEP